jgi:hypothetical protein
LAVAPFCVVKVPCMRLPIAALLLMISTPALAATPDAWAQSLSDAKLACRKASDFKNAAVVGKPLVFSDSNGKTAILVTGIWRPEHMKGARGTMLCLYDRASRTAEVTEAKNWSVVTPAKP